MHLPKQTEDEDVIIFELNEKLPNSTCEANVMMPPPPPPLPPNAQMPRMASAASCQMLQTIWSNDIMRVMRTMRCMCISFLILQCS